MYAAATACSPPSDRSSTPGEHHSSPACSAVKPSERHDSKVEAVAEPDLDPASSVNHNYADRASLAHNSLVTSLLKTALADGASMSNAHPPANLHLETDVSTTPQLTTLKETPVIYETPVEAIRPAFTSPISIAATASSLRSNLSTNSITSHSPASTSSMLASPYLAAMADITPLPSPVMNSELATAWQKQRHGSLSSHRPSSSDDITRTARSSTMSSIPITGTSPRRKKQYASLAPTVYSAATTNAAAAQENGDARTQHGRNRSISEFVPENLHNVRQRMVTIGSGDRAAAEYSMHREAHLASRRGLLNRSSDPTSMLPSPPPSNTSVAESDDADEDTLMEDGEPSEYLHIHCGIHNRLRRFRQIRQLGQGTFSKVMLATSQRLGANPASYPERDLDQNRLVAVKIVEHGPAGGADEERIEISLRREVEMLKSVSHPSLIHLKACEDQLTRTLLVLTYCPGGDLFELASDKRDLLTPKLIQRMFAELVSAVRYLHTHWIVHRDIKLENVLVNYPLDTLRQIEDPITHPTPIVTLSDLGLSRRIPDPPESPLLTTRCGSEDYAAPEILLGQPYDGRLTDGWALGVLLYALMEGRLPFDAPPGKPDRSRNTHRIARCDWIWCRFGDDDGEWDPQRGALFEGARECVEGLLKKVRMGRKPLEEIEKLDWVQKGIQVPGGIQMREQDLDDWQ